jgi:hypothetical protein
MKESYRSSSKNTETEQKQEARTAAETEQKQEAGTAAETEQKQTRDIDRELKARPPAERTSDSAGCHTSNTIQKHNSSSTQRNEATVGNRTQYLLLKELVVDAELVGRAAAVALEDTPVCGEC